MKRTLALLTLGLIVVFTASVVKAQDDATAELYKKQCVACHGADGTKTPAGAVAIKGMSAADLEKKMMGYKNGTESGKNKAMMENIAKKLDDAQIKALSAYIATF